ncbi:type III-B CRISPR module RAMP protein Cmr1 [Arachnia propionica]|uniref:Type III-B CRISPR module RAMP protein Cmr1 n=1 Tax=Arachnia propionica TaxID=1750 RepID=A0A3P1WR61_9ACTN|nr:type III-B CRISPR module RAMP protein Cmr1 [Arachnia propionica]RRD48785.1 type III-B CRISPR module RAMP protein Cmr1 [Arachnia propionica]
MPRKPPSAAPPDLRPEAVVSGHKAREHEVLLSTITPMFGGSARPAEVDLAQPVSARTVRGHLRFWWRALNGGCFGSLPALFKAESHIWGSAASEHGSPSRVDITVEPLRPAPKLSDKDLRHLAAEEGVAYGGYGVFDRGRALVEGVSRFPFKVTATCDDDLWQRDVAPAIRAWTLLGGVGRRTRRGFGSLRQYHEERALFGLPEDAPHTHRYSMLPATWLVGPAQASSEKAWFWILDKFKAQERRGPKPRGRLASPVVVKAVADPRATAPERQTFWPVAFQFRAPGGSRHRIDQVWRGLTAAEGLRRVTIGEFHD